MTVEPIRNKSQINQMYHCLVAKDPKYALLFKFGLNTGLRISDIIPVQVNDIYCNGNFRKYFSIKEKKTGKEKKIIINSTLQEAIEAFVKSNELTSESFLFPSRKGSHIGRVQAYRILKDCANSIGLEHFGTHSLRKTWGYWTYRESKYNIGLIMDSFNHSSPKITLLYIGINQEEKDALYSLVQL